MKPERLATAAMHGLGPDHVFGGGEPEFTADDVAGAMGMGHLTQLAGDYLLAKYCGFDTDRRTISSLRSGVINLIGRRWPEWFGVRGKVEVIARYAIALLVGRGKCPECEGTQWDWSQTPPAPCRVCTGTGEQSADAFPVPWDTRSAILLRELRHIESEALDAMR